MRAHKGCGIPQAQQTTQPAARKQAPHHNATHNPSAKKKSGNLHLILVDKQKSALFVDAAKLLQYKLRNKVPVLSQAPSLVMFLEELVGQVLRDGGGSDDSHRDDVVGVVVSVVVVVVWS